MKASLLALALLMPISASAQDHERAVFRASLAAAVVAHAMDLTTTASLLGESRQAMRDGQPSRYYESNPFLGHVTANPLVFGAVKMGTAAGVLWLNTKLHDSHPKLATALNLVQVGVLSSVAVHNYRLGVAQ